MWSRSSSYKLNYLLHRVWFGLLNLIRHAALHAFLDFTLHGVVFFRVFTSRAVLRRRHGSWGAVRLGGHVIRGVVGFLIFRTVWNRPRRGVAWLVQLQHAFRDRNVTFASGRTWTSWRRAGVVWRMKRSFCNVLTGYDVRNADANRVAMTI